MLTYYTNRELAGKLGINLAKWKRWSREFLPPDPLGGMQSGFTRQYGIDDAFKVYLGGHLVSTLKFTIPQARKILQDLQVWLSSVGIYRNSGNGLENKSVPSPAIKRHMIFIQSQPSATGQNMEFVYSIRGIIDDAIVEHQPVLVRRERYIETRIPPQSTDQGISASAGVKVLNVTAVLQEFVKCLEIPQKLYQLLNHG